MGDVSKWVDKIAAAVSSPLLSFERDAIADIIRAAQAEARAECGREIDVGPDVDLRTLDVNHAQTVELARRWLAEADTISKAEGTCRHGVQSIVRQCDACWQVFRDDAPAEGNTKVRDESVPPPSLFWDPPCLRSPEHGYAPPTVDVAALRANAKRWERLLDAVGFPVREPEDVLTVMSETGAGLRATLEHERKIKAALRQVLAWARALPAFHLDASFRQLHDRIEAAIGKADP